MDWLLAIAIGRPSGEILIGTTSSLRRFREPSSLSLAAEPANSNQIPAILSFDPVVTFF